jgi:hypothetical protein
VSQFPSPHLTPPASEALARRLLVGRWQDGTVDGPVSKRSNLLGHQFRQRHKTVEGRGEVIQLIAKRRASPNCLAPAPAHPDCGESGQAEAGGVEVCSGMTVHAGNRSSRQASISRWARRLLRHCGSCMMSLRMLAPKNSFNATANCCLLA